MREHKALGLFASGGVAVCHEPQARRLHESNIPLFYTKLGVRRFVSLHFKLLDWRGLPNKVPGHMIPFVASLAEQIIFSLLIETNKKRRT